MSRFTALGLGFATSVAITSLCLAGPAHAGTAKVHTVHREANTSKVH